MVDPSTNQSAATATTTKPNKKIPQHYRFDDDCCKELWQLDIFAAVNSGGEYTDELVFKAREFDGAHQEDVVLEAQVVLALTVEPRRKPYEVRMHSFYANPQPTVTISSVQERIRMLRTGHDMSLESRYDNWERIKEACYDLGAPSAFFVSADVVGPDGQRHRNERLFVPRRPAEIYVTYALKLFQALLQA